MKQSVWLLVSGGILLAVSLGVGLPLMTATESNCLHFGSSGFRHCGSVTLPHFWPGFILLVAGGFIALVLLAFGVRRWAQGRSLST